MGNDSRFGRIFQTIGDKMQDQVWFQQGKAKWDELDARSKMAVKYTLLIGTTLGVGGLVGTTLYSVASQKREVEEKLGLIQKIQSAQDELRHLKEVTSRFNGGGDQPWGQFIQEKASPAGIDPSLIQIVHEGIIAEKVPPVPPKNAKSSGKEKESPPPASIGPEETVVEASIKKINVRQLVKLVHEIENGGRTVKVRRLQIDTHPDETGYVDATLVVSAFRMKQ